MAEEISFELKSNLDIIAKEAKVLAQNIDKVYYSFKRKNTALLEQNRLESESVEGVDALQESYDDLRTQVEKVTGSKKRLAGVITNTGNNLEGLRNKINSSNDDWKNGPQNWKMNDDGISSSFEKIMKKVREFENGVQKSILKINSAVYNMGVELTASATNLKPFDLTFASSFSFNPKQFFGFGSAMKEAFELMKTFQQMRHELASLSDSSGNSSKALSLVYDIAGNSSVASATAMSAMRALGDQGILTDDKRFRDLGILSGDLQAATGIAASQWGAFTGELAFNYGLPVEGLENITSALIGTNLRGVQLEKAMQTVNKILQNTAFVAGKPTKDSIEGLTKSVGGAMKTFQAMGISAEKAGGFIEGIVDPENFEKNSFLFAKLGISASDYADTLNDVNGQQKLLDRVMGNLPKLASEITNIKNPFARLQFAKTLGLDMQIVRNMAGKTQGEIEEMIAKFQKENQAKEALEAKRKFMAAEAAKFDDMMLGLRLKVLKPVMQFLTKGYLNNFINILPKIATTIGTIFEAMTPIIETVTTAMLELIPVFTELVNTFVKPFIKMFPEAVNYLLDILQPYLGLLTRDESVLGDGKGNSASTNKITTVAFNILKLLGEIYLFIIGWKALNLIADGFFKVIGWLKPGKKNLMDTSLDEYIRRMKQIMTPSAPVKGATGIAGLLGAAGLSIFLGGGLSYLFKSAFDKAFGETNWKEVIGNEEGGAGLIGKNVARQAVGDLGFSIGSGALPYSLLAGRTSLANLSRGTKLSQLAFGSGNKALVSMEGVTRSIIAKNAVNPTIMSRAASLGTKFGTRLGPTGVIIGAGMDAYGLGEAGQSRAERWGSLASLTSTAAGALIGGGFTFGTGALPGAAIGQTLGTFIFKPLFSSIGGYLDQMYPIGGEIRKMTANLSSGVEKGMANIFKAFQLGDFDLTSKIISLTFERFILDLKKSAVTSLSLGFIGNTDDENAKKANSFLAQGKAIMKFEENDLSKYMKDPQKYIKNIQDHLIYYSGQIDKTAGVSDRDKALIKNELQSYFYQNSIDAQLARKQQEQVLLNIKEGNKEQKDHNGWQKQQAAKTGDEKIISSFGFEPNTEVFSGQYTFSQ